MLGRRSRDAVDLITGRSSPGSPGGPCTHGLGLQIGRSADAAESWVGSRVPLPPTSAMAQNLLQAVGGRPDRQSPWRSRDPAPRWPQPMPWSSATTASINSSGSSKTEPWTGPARGGRPGPGRHDDRDPEAQCFDALPGNQGSRVEVDADTCVGDQSPQIHPAVDSHVSVEGPTPPGGGHPVLHDDHVLVVKCGREPRRRRPVCWNPGGPRERGGSRRNRTRCAGVSGPEDSGGRETFTKRLGRSGTFGQRELSPCRFEADASAGNGEDGSRGTRVKRAAISGVSSSTTTVQSAARWRQTSSSAKLAMGTRSNAPSAPPTPFPAMSTFTSAHRDAAPAIDRMTKADSSFWLRQRVERTRTSRLFTGGAFRGRRDVSVE